MYSIAELIIINMHIISASGRRERKMQNLKALVTICCSVLLLAACGQSEQQPVDAAKMTAAGNLSAIKSRGEIVVVTRNAPTTWYIDRDGRASGLAHDMVADFARYLDVTPRFIVVDSVKAMLKAVENNRADMAAGGITHTSKREKRFVFGPNYFQIHQQIVCNNKHKPRKISQIPSRAGKLVVGADTSYAERLAELAEQHPDLNLQWKEVAHISTEKLFARVNNYKIGCTIADSNIVDINRRYYPSLLVMFNVSDAQHLAWIMPKGSEKLRAASAKWLKQYRQSGELAAVKKRYYGFIGKWNFFDKDQLAKKLKTVYPKYDDLFAQAAEKHNFDKWLLAAQGYQESHWNPKATSYTGVRGIMMLTKPTAKSLGVTNRLDPKQSIMGGAAYLRQMIEKLSDDIAPPESYYFALAAYNIGLYHLRDAMKLAKRQGLDPHEWASVKKMLPLLMKKKYYSTVRYGYARGREAVQYVKHIRDYSDIIAHVMKEQTRGD